MSHQDEWMAFAPMAPADHLFFAELYNYNYYLQQFNGLPWNLQPIFTVPN